MHYVYATLTLRYIHCENIVMENNTSLARTINLPLLTLYGLGTILGAGIYVLIGKVAGQAGLLAPLAFIVAAFIAWITALADMVPRCQ